MVILLFRFKIECYFNPPLPIETYHAVGLEYDGFEVHEEMMYASSAAVAARAMKTMVLKRIGNQKHRLSSLTISEPELIIGGLHVKK